jgi:hypothetical protein
MGFRSSRWYSEDDRNSTIHRASTRRGSPLETFEGGTLAIAGTASALTPCDSLLNEPVTSRHGRPLRGRERFHASGCRVGREAH